MRGTWTGSGTFETSSTPVIPAAVAVVSAIVIGAVVDWLTHHVWEVIGAAAAVLALAAAVVYGMVRLVRWHDVRDARWGQQHRPSLTAQATPLPPGQARVLPGGGFHLHLHGLSPDEQATIIRQAIGRSTP